MLPILGISERHVRRLVRQGVLPKPDARGQYDLVGCIRAYIRQLRERALAQGVDLEAERVRLVRGKADRVELQVGELRGALVPAEQLERTLEFFATSARSRLLTLPRKVAVEILPDDPRRAEAILDRAVRNLLEELASDETLPSWLAGARSGPRRRQARGA